jgi:hypothetical protein
MVVIAAASGPLFLLITVRNPEESSPRDLVFVIPFVLFGVWIGLRTTRVSVQLLDDSLLVHNQLRSHRVALVDVTRLEIRRRLALWALGTEVIGVVVAREAEVWLQATRAVRSPHGRLFSQSIGTTRQQMTDLAEATDRQLVDSTVKA